MQAGTWKRTGKPVLGAVCAAAVLGIAACATPPEDPAARAAYDEANDPIEPFNRFVFDANQGFDTYFLKPIATAYRDAVPEGMRDAAHNFLRNLRSPLILIHDVLQGEPRRASVTFRRFLVNSVIGFAGLVDVADMALGLPFHDEDFGQTLAVWGAGEGLYLVLPLFGPSNVRDAIGLGLDSVINPTSIAINEYGPAWGPFALTVLSALDQRSRNIDSLEDVERTSIDFYATLRSLYRQKREGEIYNGRPPEGDRVMPTLDAKAPDALAPNVTGPLAAAETQPLQQQAASSPGYTELGDWSGGFMPSIAFNPPPVPSPSGPAEIPAPAATQPPSVARERTPPVATILFHNGSAGLTANDRALLRHVAVMAQQNGAGLRVVGHAGESAAGMDELGLRFFNFDMSWARANAAAEELKRAGLPHERIVIEAKSEAEPMRSASAPDDSGNRRVTVYFE